MSDEWLAISEAIFRAEQITGGRIPEDALLAAVDRGAVRTEEIPAVRALAGGLIWSTWESTGRVAWNDVLRWIDQSVGYPVTDEDGNPSSPPRTFRGAIAPGALKRFLMGFADGQKTQEQCLRAAEEHFGMPIPNKNVWRPAWKDLPAEKKLPVGYHPKSGK